jgi:phenylalanyl-tRNA synthetase beta chain
MRVSLKHLTGYFAAFPIAPMARRVRDLLDDIGIEVKRVEIQYASGELIHNAYMDAELGEDGVSDVYFTLELLANRGDHRCYAGIARECRGRAGGELRLPPLATLDVGAAPLPLVCETPLGLLYTATLLEIAPGQAGGLPSALLEPLTVAGLAPVLPAVDISNLVNLELGQPTHCFDADKIKGEIVVRESRAGERAWPLFFAEPVELVPGTLVIADEAGPLAIAGVIGCEGAKVTATTRRILLESATFDPVAVRQAAKRLGLSTDASQRFERGADPTMALQGAGRVVHLMEQYAGARRVGSTGVVGAWCDPQRTLSLSVARANAYLGASLSVEEARARLARLDFQVSPEEGDHLTCRIPPHRLWDVEHVECLYEELAKTIGYNQLPDCLPSGSLGCLPTPRQRLQGQLEEVLLGLGFFEVITDGFHDRQSQARLGLPEGHPLARNVEILNAIDGNFSLLKNNCLAQALAAVAANTRFQEEEVRMFECTRTFHPAGDDTTGPEERPTLWLVAAGPEPAPSWRGKPGTVDVFFLKGLVEELGRALRLPGLALAPVVDEGDGGQIPIVACLHAQRRALIVLRGLDAQGREQARPVGGLGEVDPGVAAAFDLERVRPVYLELLLDRLPWKEDQGGFPLPPPRPPSVRMLAFTLPGRLAAGAVAEMIKAAGPEWLERVEIRDLYAHQDEAGLPVRTITYALLYRNDQSDHSAEELNRITLALVAAVEAEEGAFQGVRLRQ